MSRRNNGLEIKAYSFEGLRDALPGAVKILGKLELQVGVGIIHRDSDGSQLYARNCTADYVHRGKHLRVVAGDQVKYDRDELPVIEDVLTSAIEYLTETVDEARGFCLRRETLSNSACKVTIEEQS